MSWTSLVSRPPCVFDFPFVSRYVLCSLLWSAFSDFLRCLKDATPTLRTTPSTLHTHTATTRKLKSSWACIEVGVGGRAVGRADFSLLFQLIWYHFFGSPLVLRALLSRPHFASLLCFFSHSSHFTCSFPLLLLLLLVHFLLLLLCIQTKTRTKIKSNQIEFSAL